MQSKVNKVKMLLESGANNLYNNYPHIDKLNVFPVPDGDTGTNMNLTVTNGFNDIKDNSFDNIGDLLKAFAKGLILGARGNSGVIFSQIIKGLSLGMKDSKDLSVVEWKQGLIKAKEMAYKAVMKPIEGTILTVIRETADSSNLLDDNMDLKEFWNNVIKFSNDSLENTPNLLKVLKDVGVVDSGGYGLVKFLEGINHTIQNDTIVKKLNKLEKNDGHNIEMSTEQEFGYCTETIVILNDKEKENFNTNQIKGKLEIYGNSSIVVIQDEEIVKIHTHAINPGQVLSFLQQFGTLEKIKVENMNSQVQKQLINDKKEWTEKTVIKNERKLEKEVALIGVVQSDNIKNYFENELALDIAINAGSKMNPSTKDFIEAIEKVDAKNVFIFPNNSNVLLAAKQAQKEEKKSKVFVVPTKTLQQGMVCLLNFDPTITPSKNNSIFLKSIKNVTSFSITQASKAAKIDNVDISEGEYMAIVDGKIVAGEKTILNVFKKQLKKYITNKSEIITIFTGINATKKDIINIRKFLDENFDVEYEIINGDQQIYNFIISIE